MKQSSYVNPDIRFLSRDELLGVTEEYVSLVADATKPFYARPELVSSRAVVPGRNANSALYGFGYVDADKQSLSLAERLLGRRSVSLAHISFWSFDDVPWLEPRIAVRDESVQRGLEESLNDVAHRYSAVFSQARLYDEL